MGLDYLLEGQSLVTKGADGFFRNPIYTGAFLIWFGLAAACSSGAVLLLTVLYVIPAYVLNIRGEEQMMLSRYGDEYREYQQGAAPAAAQRRRVVAPYRLAA